MNYIVTKNPEFFQKIDKYNYLSLEEAWEKLKNIKKLAVDTETTGLNCRMDKVFAVQVGTGQDNFLFDLQDYSTTIRFKEFEGITITLAEVIPFLKDKHLVFHNAMFDMGFLMNAGFFPQRKHLWDTMVASQVLNNGIEFVRHSFKDVMDRWLNVKIDKTEQKNIHRIKLSTKEAIQYCFDDVDRLLELMKVGADHLRNSGAMDTFRLQCGTILPIVYMELCGLPLPERGWNAKLLNDKHELAKTKDIVTSYIFEKFPEYRGKQMDLFSQDATGITLNLDSPKQMIPVFKKLGINTEVDDKKTGGVKDSIQADVIKLSNHEFVPLWLDYQEASTRVSNFGENILPKIKNGRVYPKYKLMVDTSRIAAKTEGDMNALNIPSDEVTRRCIAAPPGWKIVVADYEAQEGVILADRSGDPVMVASVVEGLDLHCAFARVVFPELADLSDDEIKKKHSKERTFVKAPRFAFSYGASGHTVHKNAGIPLDKANELEKKFKEELHPEVFKWGQRVLKEALKVGYIESVDGWRLHLPFYQEIKDLQRKFDSLSREDWALYKQGKMEYLKEKELEELGMPYTVMNEEAYEFYIENKGWVRNLFKKMGQYTRLCLNNPIQSTGAHMTKTAMCYLYDYIVENNHQWKAKIIVAPYDEIGMEVIDELVPDYKEKLGYFMREAGNKYLYSGILKINADADVGQNWQDAKKPPKPEAKEA